VRRLDLEFEDVEVVFDQRAYDENAGASDSEEEASVGVPMDELLDRQQHLAESLAALVDDMEAIGEIINNNNNEPAVPVCTLPGPPAGWIPPSAPEGWKPERRVSKQPAFKDIDNPGNWSEHTYRHKFNTTLKTVNENGKEKKVKVKECKCHSLPTG